MVDLGTREDVKGLVIVTWQGDGQGEVGGSEGRGREMARVE